MALAALSPCPPLRDNSSGMALVVSVDTIPRFDLTVILRSQFELTFVFNFIFSTDSYVIIIIRLSHPFFKSSNSCLNGGERKILEESLILLLMIQTEVHFDLESKS